MLTKVRAAVSSGQLITSLVPLSSPSVEYNCHNKTPFIMSTGGDTPRSFDQRLKDLLNNSANIRNNNITNDGDFQLVDGVGGLSISSTPNPSVAMSGITSRSLHYLLLSHTKSACERVVHTSCKILARCNSGQVGEYFI